MLPPPLSVEGGESSQGMPIPALVSCIEMTTYNCAKYKLLAVQASLQAWSCNWTTQHLHMALRRHFWQACVSFVIVQIAQSFCFQRCFLLRP